MINPEIFKSICPQGLEKKLDTIVLKGSGTWKTWTGKVDDAMFARSIPKPYRNNDLFFGARSGKPLSVARVEMRRRTSARH